MPRHSIQTVRVHQYGGAEQLRLEEIPCPEPQADEVLLRVYAAGVLPADWKMRQGFFKDRFAISLPYIPGSAVAGVVEAVGPGVTTFREGEAVFGRSAKGAYAEYTCAAAETLALKPEAISFAEAATISGGATTAWAALFENGGLQAGQRVLIHGAAGGVGLFAVQFARWKGAEVVGTASTANVDFVRSLGAESVIDYTTTPFEQVVADVDLVLDTLGGDVLQRSMSIIKRGGTLVSLLEEPSQEQAQAYGIRAMNNTVTFPFPSTHLLQTIGRLMQAGEIKTAIAARFSLHEVQQAHQLSQTGHGRGRIVLYPGSTERQEK